MNFVVARRLEKWPNAQSRAEAVRMLDSGASLPEVLRRYPTRCRTGGRTNPSSLPAG